MNTKLSLSIFCFFLISSVALRVVNKGSHTFGKTKAELIVEFFTLSRAAHFVSSPEISQAKSKQSSVLPETREKSENYEEDKILLIDVPETTSEETIVLYARAISNVSTSKVNVNPDIGRALVSFQGPIGMLTECFPLLVANAAKYLCGTE